MRSWTSGLRPVRYDVALALQQLAAADAKLGALIERVGPFELRVKALIRPSKPFWRPFCTSNCTPMPPAPFWDGYCRCSAICIPSRSSCWLCRMRCCAPPAFLRASFSSLRDLAAKTLDGTVPPLATIRRLSDAEIVERLGKVRGIGTWTAEMLLMFRLGRPDVFPGTDYGIRKGYLLMFWQSQPGQANQRRDAAQAGANGTAGGALEAVALGG